ncbi:MAG: hydrogenase maturation nickel metallochaperone HypA [Anaerolineales bacterium]
MHELPVTEQILKVVLDHARKAEAHRVVHVNLVIGDLTTFVDESIQFYFDFLSRGTEAEGATLHIRRIPACVRCHACGGEFAPDGVDWRCPHCGGLGGEVLAGRESYIESIEVE